MLFLCSDVWSSDIKYKLSFTYNLNANASYFYRPAYQRYKDQIKILHFIGPGKPWLWARDTQGRVLDRADATFRTEHVQLWWDVHDGHAPQWGLGAAHYAAVDPRAEFRTEWVHGEAHHTHTPKNPKWDFSAIEQRLNELIHKGPYPSK
jgi:lipopolysaccharide biosynthesis glycosyltransferase